MHRFCLLGLLAVALAASPALAQVQLKWKFPKGSYQTRVTVDTEQVLNIAGMDTETNAAVTIVLNTEIGERNAAGEVHVKNDVNEFQINIGGTAGEYQFDSGNPDQKGQSALEVLRDIHKLVAKRSMTLVYDRKNELTKVEVGRDGFDQLPVEIQELAKNEFDPELIREALLDEKKQISSKPLEKGDSWEASQSALLGAGQVMDFETTYTYEGTVEKDGRTLDKITGKTSSIDFYLADGSPLPLKVKESDLKPESSSTEVYFDRAKGRTVASTVDLHITGTIQFEVNGMELPATLDLKMKTVTDEQ